MDMQPPPPVYTPVQPPAPAQRRFPVWAIILIVIVALCLLAICAFVVILALLGPAVGNVFSNVVGTLEVITPVP